MTAWTELAFAGSAEDEDSMARVRAYLHDELFAAMIGRRRLGPVVWRTYEPGYAAEALEKAGISDDRGLIAWLAAHDGTVLVIGSLDFEMLS